MTTQKVKRRASIRDVAREAGVSPTTVSHALNGKGRVDKKTRERVVEVAERLQYRANQNAINLLKHRSGVLALTIGAPAENPVGLGDMEFFIRYMSGATTTALERGFTLMLIPSTKADALSGIEIDGAMVIDPVSDDPLVGELRKRHIPVVTSGRDPDLESSSWVDNDLKANSERLLDHMAEQGATRIGMVSPPTLYSYGIDFRAGYLAWCEKHGQEPLVVEAENSITEKGGFEAATALLSRPDAPDAIFAGLDRHALGTLLAAESLGIHVPEDLMLASATDSQQMSSAQPSITALSLSPELVGTRSVEMLIALIEEPGAEAGPIVVPASIAARESTLGRRG